MRSKKEWDADLPNTSQWLPRDAAAETFAEAFYKRCQHIERTILLRSQYERSMAIDAFDSGAGLEDIIREELGNVCPRRYAVKAGTIDDRNGRTAGDKELVRAMCVLGQGAVSWGVCESPSSIKMASFMDDFDEPLIPVYHHLSQEKCALYPLIVSLLAHLYRSVLGAEDIQAYYGSKITDIFWPKDPGIRLDPDQI